MTAYTTFRLLRPVRTRDEPAVMVQIVAELALVTAAVVLQGGWGSPFALCLIPTCMLAGLSLGTWPAAQMTAATVVVVTVQHLPQAGTADGLRDGALWAGLLGVVRRGAAG